MHELSATIENYPWRGLSYLLYTVQVLYICLDAGLAKSDLSWRNAALTVEFLLAALQSLYQLARIVVFHAKRRAKFYAITGLLLLSLLMQLALTVFPLLLDLRKEFELVVFLLVLVWGFLNPLTFSLVASVVLPVSPQDLDKTPSVVGVMQSIVTRHLPQTPYLVASGVVLAVIHAVGNAIEGYIMLGLFEVVLDPVYLEQRNRQTEDERDYELFWAYILVLVWFLSLLARIIFDVCIAELLSRLEVWLRDKLMERANYDKTMPVHSPFTVQDYKEAYQSDVSQVEAIYIALFHGFLLNVLAMVASWIVLAVLEIRFAVLSLTMLAMISTMGPTDLAQSASDDIEDVLRHGSKMIGSLSGRSYIRATNEDDAAGADDNSVDRHRNNILRPLQSCLFRNAFYSESIDTFSLMYGSYLTIVMVIALTQAEMGFSLKPTYFVPIFYLFQQIITSSTKLSVTLTQIRAKAPFLANVDDIIFSEKPTEVVEFHEDGYLPDDEEQKPSPVLIQTILRQHTRSASDPRGPPQQNASLPLPILHSRSLSDPRTREGIQRSLSLDQ